MKNIMAFLIAFSFTSSSPADVIQYKELASSEEVKKKKKKGKKLKGKGKKKKKSFFSKVFGSK